MKSILHTWIYYILYYNNQALPAVFFLLHIDKMFIKKLFLLSAENKAQLIQARFFFYKFFKIKVFCHLGIEKLLLKVPVESPRARMAGPSY